LADKSEIKIRPDESLLARWQEFIWKEEERRRSRRIGNGILTGMLRAFLDAAEGVSPAEQTTRAASPDMLSGLSAEDRAAVEDVVRIFQEGSGLKAVLLSGVNAWREMKRESQSIRAVNPPAESRERAG